LSREAAVARRVHHEDNLAGILAEILGFALEGIDAMVEERRACASGKIGKGGRKGNPEKGDSGNPVHR
jgi:hypothetical protein